MKKSDFRQRRIFISGLFYLGDEKYQNKGKALDLFMIASDAGFVPAQYMAGKLLVSGDAGKSNLYMGKDLLKKLVPVIMMNITKTKQTKH